MRLRSHSWVLSCAAALFLASNASAADLKMVSVDLEGGAATIYLTPEGQSLLVDSGSPPGPASTMSTTDDSARIVAAAKKLGITRFNYFLITHYHRDHIGGLGALIEKMPVENILDHGVTREEGPAAEATYAAYLKAIEGRPRRSLKAGDVVKIGSLTLDVVISDGVPIAQARPGAGAANPACAGSTDNSDYIKLGEENPRSVGVLFTYGVTRILSLGDLTWNKERELYCPIDKVGPVDILLPGHHGITVFRDLVLSNSPFAVAAQDPLVVVMGNGPVKGGGPEILARFKKSPRLQGFWPAHQTAMDAKEGELLDYTANLLVGQDGFATAVTVSDTGQITVTNERNGFGKTYRARLHK